MSLAGPGVLALVAVAIVAVMWWLMVLNLWYHRELAQMTPEERDREAYKAAAWGYRDDD